MTRILLAGCERLPRGDGDEDVLIDALADAGCDAEWIVWDAPHVDPADADLVVLRATWDYTGRRDEFLRWCESVPRLRNDARVIRWNTDKVYLRDLAAAGVSTVPTEFFAPGEQPWWRLGASPDGGWGHPERSAPARRDGWSQPPDAQDRSPAVRGPTKVPLSAKVTELEMSQPSAEFVVKPSVGAGSREVGRFAADDLEAAEKHVRRLHEAGYTALVQPYVPAVDTEGETACVFIAGAYSHAFVKGPMLAGSAFDSSGLFVAEKVHGITPDPDTVRFAETVIDAACELLGIPRTDLLYARVDVVRGEEPMVLELELSEPSLGLSMGNGAAERLARAIRDVIG